MTSRSHPPQPNSMKMTETIYKCRECESDTDWTTELVEVFGEKAVVCDECCEKDRQRQSDTATPFEKYPQMPIEDIIRPLYMETNINHPDLSENARIAWKDIQHWTPTLGKGIDILGHPRQGKTRIMTLLLRKLHNDGHAMKIFYAGEFHAELVMAKKSPTFISWRDEVVNIPILAIDDLFAEKLTETTEKGLFEILNQRMERKLPIMITRQVAKEQAMNLFQDKMRGYSFFERLRETTIKYTFNQENLKI